MSEIGVKLGGDNTEFVGMMSDSVSKADGFAGDIATRVGDRLLGLRHVSTAIATALGINLENIADHLALFLAGTSKADQEAYKAAEQVGQQATDLALKNMESRLSAEDRYQMSLKTRDKLIRDIDNMTVTNGESLLELNNKKLELEKTISTIQAEDAKRDAEATNAKQKAITEEIAALVKADDMQHKTAMAKLDSVTKEIALTNDIISIKQVIQGLDNVGIEHKELSIDLTQRQAELEAVQQKNQADHVKTLQEINKTKFDSLSIDDKIQAYQESMKNLTSLIKQGMIDGVDTSTDQLNLLQNQEAVNKLLIQQATMRKTAEAGVVSEYQAQLIALQKMNGGGGISLTGSNTTTLGALQAQAAAAQRALDTLLSITPSMSQRAPTAEDIGSARALVQQTQTNLSSAFPFASGYSDTNQTASTLGLDFSTIIPAGSSAASSNAQAQVLKDISTQTQAQREQLVAINTALTNFFDFTGTPTPGP